MGDLVEEYRLPNSEYSTYIHITNFISTNPPLLVHNHPNPWQFYTFLQHSRGKNSFQMTLMFTKTTSVLNWETDLEKSFTMSQMAQSTFCLLQNSLC